MSNTRHDPAVRGYGVTHPAGRATIPVDPGWDQLLCPLTGAMTVRTSTDVWVVPAHRVLWLPGGQPATVQTRGRTAVRALYLDEGLRRLPGEAQVLDLTALARELIDHVVSVCPLDLEREGDRALLTVLFDQLEALPASPLRLPMPIDARARDAASSLLADPARSIDDLPATVGASRRTLERRFRDETGLTLATWQRRARTLRALELLADDTTVTDTAHLVGYSTPSSFVASFKAETGATPGAFRP
jgi:AraC-like DNA-binding protein